MGRFLRFGLLLSLIFFLATGFQNCMKSAHQEGEVGCADCGQDKIVSSTSKFNTIKYGLNLGTYVPRVDLSIDLDAGTVSYPQRGGAVIDKVGHSCPMDSARLGQLQQLIADGNICMHGPTPADISNCAAISAADIELSSKEGGAVELLRPDMCGYGRWLCGGDDQVLRALLLDLLRNRVECFAQNYETE